MVAAGVYLVARSMSLFVGSAEASIVVAIIGVITSLIAATIAITQVDIKRVLAYSTVSQLGYMIMALGLYGYDTAMGHHSPGFYAGTFHLMTHAFFKALLFLAAGSVIHAVHTNDIREMGGLLPKLKITAPTFMIASLSIAGIFPLAGFWSKDEIVATTVHHPIFYFLTLAIAFMTAFYMWRLCFMVFFGKPRDVHRFEHAHESPKSMSYPLIVLAVLAVCAGWVGIPWLSKGFATFVYHGEAYHPHFSFLNAFIASTVALSGIGLAYLMYYKKSISAEKIGAKIRPLYLGSFNKWYFDEIYHVILINPIMAFARYTWTFDARVIDGVVNGTAWLTMLWSDLKMWFDTWIVDGAVNGSGWVVSQLGNMLRLIQTGKAQSYALFMGAAIIAIGFWKYETTFVEGIWPTMTIIVALSAILLAIVGRLVPQQSASPEEDK